MRKAIRTALGSLTLRSSDPAVRLAASESMFKSRKPTVANPEVMYRSMTTVHAANICMWLKRNLEFDPVRAEYAGLLDRLYAGWEAEGRVPPGRSSVDC